MYVVCTNAVRVRTHILFIFVTNLSEGEVGGWVMDIQWIATMSKYELA